MEFGRGFIFGFLTMGVSICGILMVLDYRESKRKLELLEIKEVRRKLMERYKRGKL